MAGLEVSQPGESTSISGETDRKGEGIHLLRGSHSQPRPHILNPSTTPADVQAGEIILVFFIGSAPVAADARVQASIEKEAAVHGDILQEDYIDTYENLTLKSISMIRWVSQNCPNARYVAKIDDDTYVNIPLLIRSLQDQTKIMDEELLSDVSLNRSVIRNRLSPSCWA